MGVSWPRRCGLIRKNTHFKPNYFHYLLCNVAKWWIGFKLGPMTRETSKSLTMVLFVKSRILDLRIYTRVWVQCIWNWSFLDLEPHVNPSLDSFSVQGDEPLFIFPYKREGDEPLALYTMYHCLQALKVEYSMEFRLKCCCCWIKSRFVSNPWPCCTTRHLLQHILRKK